MITDCENMAIIVVLGGTHPGNCVDNCRRFCPSPGNADFKDFIEKDIPETWHLFRQLCRLMYERKIA